VQRDIERYIGWLRAQAKVGLHLGCGPDIIPGLINCDLFNPAADRAIGATDLSEFENRSIDYIETHHMIEHLSFSESEQAFAEWGRVMVPGGHLVVTCPDFSALIRKWIATGAERNWGSTIQMFYGSQEHEGMFHKSGYDGPHLDAILSRHGFETELYFTPYPRRPTPSLCLIARRR
jgi:SAM-dependent methyltransferase